MEVYIAGSPQTCNGINKRLFILQELTTITSSLTAAGLHTHIHPQLHGKITEHVKLRLLVLYYQKTLKSNSCVHTW